MDEIPTNLEEAVAALLVTIPDEELKKFASWDRERAGNEAHHTVGRWIRNEWKLWVEGTPLREWFDKEIHAQHPDDMSSIIIDALWNDLNEKPRRTVELLAKYEAHWEQFK
jgi:hypothetical protein